VHLKTLAAGREITERGGGVVDDLLRRRDFGNLYTGGVEQGVDGGRDALECLSENGGLGAGDDLPSVGYAELFVVGEWLVCDRELLLVASGLPVRYEWLAGERCLWKC
jgi:hypothetical protein